jgi:antitoxin MazE
MEVSVVKIGNSKGIRLSKTLLDKYKIRDSVNLVLKKNHIIIKPLSRPRKGWDKLFSEINSGDSDRLPVQDTIINENFEQWK